jgi:hypothetical protein
MMRVRVWRLDVFWGQLGGFRPCVWIDLPQSQLVLWLGWQRPRLMWLR